MVKFHAGQLVAGAHFGDRHLDAALRESEREGQPNGSPADDQHIGIDSTGHGSSATETIRA